MRGVQSLTVSNAVCVGDAVYSVMNSDGGPWKALPPKQQNVPPGRFLILCLFMAKSANFSPKLHNALLPPRAVKISPKEKGLNSTLSMLQYVYK